MIEKLVSAALIRAGVVESRGFKSHYLIRAALGDGEPTKASPGDQEGFLTSTGRFVDRREAQNVAVASGQLKALMRRELLSSDIW